MKEKTQNTQTPQKNKQKENKHPLNILSLLYGLFTFLTIGVFFSIILPESFFLPHKTPKQKEDEQ